MRDKLLTCLNNEKAWFPLTSILRLCDIVWTMPKVRELGLPNYVLWQAGSFGNQRTHYESIGNTDGLFGEGSGPSISFNTKQRSGRRGRKNHRYHSLDSSA